MASTAAALDGAVDAIAFVFWASGSKDNKARRNTTQWTENYELVGIEQ